MPDFEVSVHNIFEAENPKDAVNQMVEWLLEAVTQAGYRVTNLDTSQTDFIDAEKCYGCF